MASSFFLAAFFLLLAASTTPACPAGMQLASYGFLLAAACAVHARASPSRGAPTRAHRAALGYIFAGCAVLARVVVGSDVNPYADDISMHNIATALGADRALGWTNDTAPCVNGWTGVSCNGRGRVSKILVPNAGLNGTLARDFVFLTGLQELDLSLNKISGDVPVFLDITKLRLDGNQFSTVPVEFLSDARSLQFFVISVNPRLRRWELPNEPSGVHTLQLYVANKVQLSGNLSGFLRSGFSNLHTLSLSSNYLTGQVPATFASHTLYHLDLSHNGLTGPVDFLANLPGLQVLDLSGNGFTGPLPDFSAHSSLLIVDLSHNRFTGIVPASLVGSRDSTISISGNLFQGELPKFAALVRSDIAEAALDCRFCRPEPGPCDEDVQSLIAIAGAFRFPEAFALSWKGNSPCNGWLGVDCDKNNEITGINFCRLGLNGTIHPAFGDFKMLVLLNLADNNITGEVPVSITTIPSLKMLDVFNNSLEGTMPTFPRDVTILAGGNKNLTVAGASRLCISDAMLSLAAAAATIAVLVLA